MQLDTDFVKKFLIHTFSYEVNFSALKLTVL